MKAKNYSWAIVFGLVFGVIHNQASATIIQEQNLSFIFEQTQVSVQCFPSGCRPFLSIPPSGSDFVGYREQSKSLNFEGAIVPSGYLLDSVGFLLTSTYGFGIYVSGYDEAFFSETETAGVVSNRYSVDAALFPGLSPSSLTVELEESCYDQGINVPPFYFENSSCTARKSTTGIFDTTLELIPGDPGVFLCSFDDPLCVTVGLHRFATAVVTHVDDNLFDIDDDSNLVSLEDNAWAGMVKLIYRFEEQQYTVPEPGTLALLFLGLLGIGTLTRPAALRGGLYRASTSWLRRLAPTWPWTTFRCNRLSSL